MHLEGRTRHVEVPSGDDLLTHARIVADGHAGGKGWIGKIACVANGIAGGGRRRECNFMTQRKSQRCSFEDETVMQIKSLHF